MSTRDGTIIRDCRTCSHSDYQNRFRFKCDVFQAIKTRPCKCESYDMDGSYATANDVKKRTKDDYVYTIKPGEEP